MKMIEKPYEDLEKIVKLFRFPNSESMLYKAWLHMESVLEHYKRIDKYSISIEYGDNGDLISLGYKLYFMIDTPSGKGETFSQLYVYEKS